MQSSSPSMQAASINCHPLLSSCHRLTVNLVTPTSSSPSTFHLPHPLPRYLFDNQSPTRYWNRKPERASTLASQSRYHPPTTLSAPLSTFRFRSNLHPASVTQPLQQPSQATKAIAKPTDRNDRFSVRGPGSLKYRSDVSPRLPGVASHRGDYFATYE